MIYINGARDPRARLSVAIVTAARAPASIYSPGRAVIVLRSFFTGARSRKLFLLFSRPAPRDHIGEHADIVGYTSADGVQVVAYTRTK